MKLPISVKGVVLDGERVVLLKNERDEWELPGGRLEAGEGLRECVEREVSEELGRGGTVERPRANPNDKLGATPSKRLEREDSGSW